MAARVRFICSEDTPQSIDSHFCIAFAIDCGLWGAWTARIYDFSLGLKYVAVNPAQARLRASTGFHGSRAVSSSTSKFLRSPLVGVRILKKDVHPVECASNDYFHSVLVNIESILRF